MFITKWFSLDTSGETTNWITSIWRFIKKRLMRSFTISNTAISKCIYVYIIHIVVYPSLSYDLSISSFFWTPFLFPDFFIYKLDFSLHFFLWVYSFLSMFLYGLDSLKGHSSKTSPIISSHQSYPKSSQLK